MAKTPSDKLYRLIRSLSPTEKRYFRIFIRGKTERASKYAQLFEAMAEMDDFDEALLKTKIYKSQATEGKKYSELKAYLYELVLKCLQSFDEQHSVEHRLNQALQSVAVLHKRGHYTDCREILQKAAKLAHQHESFSHQLDIIRWEKQLAYTRMDADFLHKHLEHLNAEEERILQQLSNAAQYRKSFFQVYAAIKRETIYRGDDRLAQLRRLVGHETFGGPDRADSHKARVLYYRTLNLYHYAAANYDEFYETGNKLIGLIESQPHFLRENISDYIAALSNLILACGLRRKYEEVRVCLQKLRDLKPITEDDRRKIHRQYFTGIFALCTYMGEFEDARHEIERCQSEAKGFDPHEYETASFHYQYCLICFGCGDYAAALDHLNQWLCQPRSVEREDLQRVGRVLSLILHFELNNTVLLESLLRATTRFLKKKNRAHDLEQRFVHFVAELIRQPVGREQVHLFTKMKAYLEQDAATPATQSLLQTFDLDSWLESKINGQTFAAVVQAKWQRESVQASD
jgi:hypothetical protein